MEQRLIHELEIAIHEAIRPIHRFTHTFVKNKMTDAGHVHSELSIVFSLKEDAQVYKLLEFFSQ